MINQLRHLRFPLPEGLTWVDADPTPQDVQWLDQSGWGDYANWREETIGQIVIRLRYRREDDGLVREIEHRSIANLVTKRELERGAERILDGIQFHWTEGNFGCHCNRNIFFAEAGGEARPSRDLGEYSCEGPRIACVWPPFLADDHVICGALRGGVQCREPVLEGSLCEACLGARYGEDA